MPMIEHFQQLTFQSLTEDRRYYCHNYNQAGLFHDNRAPGMVSERIISNRQPSSGIWSEFVHEPPAEHWQEHLALVIVSVGLDEND